MPCKQLTEPAIEKLPLPAEGKRVEHWDTIAKCLSLTHTHNDTKTWYFKYRMKGSIQYKKRMGTWPEISLKQARDLAREYSYQISRGLNPIILEEEKRREQEKAAQETVTIDNLFQEYLERHCKPNTRRWKPTQQTYNNHIAHSLGHLELGKIQKRDIIRLLDKLLVSDSPSAATHVHALLRGMFNWAISRDLMTYSPCYQIKKPLKTKSRDRYFNDKEIKEFWTACEKIGYPYGHIGKLLLLTGQRRSEISDLRWSEIDFEKGVIKLSAERVKAKRSHETPLSPTAIEILKSIPRHRGAYVFTTTGGKKPVDGFGQIKADFEEHFKSEGWCFHDSRRTCATNIAQLGAPPHLVKAVLNHADHSVTAIYDRHTYLPEKRNLLDRWDARIQEILKQ